MPVSDEVALAQHMAKPAEARRLVHADVGLHRHRLISAGLITDALCGEVVQVTKTTAKPFKVTCPDCGGGSIEEQIRRTGPANN
jgi:hypothetical protein